MQRHAILRYAVGLCLVPNLLVFPVRSADIIQLNPVDKPDLEGFIYAARDFQSSPSDSSGTLPHGDGIDRLILTGHKVDPTGARPLPEVEQRARPSAADLGSSPSLLAASDVEP